MAKEPLEVIYVRAPRSLKAELVEASEEDGRTLAREVGYLLRLGLDQRAAMKRSAGGRSRRPPAE